MCKDNLLTGPDAEINHRIALLRTKSSEQRLVDSASPVPGVFFGVDPEAKIDGRFTTGGDGLINLDYVTKTTPRWLSMHFALGNADLGGRSVLGFVCKASAPEAATFRVCVRSAKAEGYRDVFFPKHVVAFSQVSTHVDLLRLEGLDGIPEKAPWRDLILFFQTSSARIAVIDLRVFIV